MLPRRDVVRSRNIEHLCPRVLFAKRQLNNALNFRERTGENGRIRPETRKPNRVSLLDLSFALHIHACLSEYLSQQSGVGDAMIPIQSVSR